MEWQARRGKAWYGLARHGVAGRGLAWQARRGPVWHGGVRSGKAWQARTPNRKEKNYDLSMETARCNAC